MFRNRCLFVLALLLLLPGAAQAANTVLAGTFDGTEAKAAPLPGTCGGSDPLAYQDAGSFQVSVTGTYSVYDVLYLQGMKNNGVDVSVLIYIGVFDIDNPYANLVRPNPDEYGQPDAVDLFGTYNLNAGQTYRIVVQQYCVNGEGAWGVTFSGPGEVDSSLTVSTPSLTEGSFTATDPEASTVCSDGQYHVSGPVQVPVTGTYYYNEVSWYTDFFDVCVLVYEDGFDPAQPAENRVPAYDALYGVDYLDDAGTIELESGKDYYFVVQPWDTAATGDYFFVLAPPAPFRINKALAGAWYDPGTNGQGFFLDVYENRDFMFLSWFTYDLQRPVDGTAELGEPGHRWLTAQGNYSDSTAELVVNLSQGGVFDSPAPEVPDPEPIGSMTVHFSDCMTGTVDYSLETPAVAGQVPITTIGRLPDHVELCELMTKGPGVPVPF